MNLLQPWRRLCREQAGQDLIEYALMAGFVAVAAGAILTPMAPTLNVVFSKVHSLLVKYGG
jgi:Flp pilus assembly pilin Flp